MVGEHFNRKDAVYVFGPREPIVEVEINGLYHAPTCVRRA
jgi:hypothetical protein